MRMRIICTMALIFTAVVFADESWKLYDDSEVAQIHIQIDSSRLEWIYEASNWNSDSLHPATIRFKNALIDEQVDSVAFRLRGNTSREAHKKSFKLSFNSFIPGRQFYGVDKLNLNGEHNDPSVMRSKLCWDFFQQIGVPSSRAAHAAVYINDQYYGVYISVEHIDDEFLQRQFNDPSGNLWKCLWPADLTFRGFDGDAYYPYYDETRPYELKTNKDSYDYSQLARLITMLNYTSAEAFADSMMKLMDVSSLIKYFTVNILTGSWDDYWSLMNNYYLYHEPERDRFYLIPYDYDNTLGIDFFDTDWAGCNPYEFPLVYEGFRPLILRILADPKLRNLYTHFLEFYGDRIYAGPQGSGHIDSLQNLLAEWVENDPYYPLDYGFTFQDFLNSTALTGYSNKHVKYGIKAFLEARRNSLPDYLEYVEAAPFLYKFEYEPEFPLANDSIVINASAFSAVGLDSVNVLVYSEDNAGVEVYPMYFDPLEYSQRVDDHDRWTVTLAPVNDGGLIRIQLAATDMEGRKTIFPASGPLSIKAGSFSATKVCINEFLALNNTFNTDNNGDFDDWLELYNPGPQSVDLNGYYLSDDPENLDKWQFEGAAILAAGGYLMVWCDEDGYQQGWHTNFKLSATGEFLALTAPDGNTIIDSLTFNSQTADRSQGRLPDGSESWQILPPSPGSTNTATALEETDTILPATFLTAYPNPFNNAVTIRFSLPVSRDVRITFFNSAGQNVWEHTYPQQPAGEHILRWTALNRSGRQLSSGVYWCVLKTAHKTYTQKIVLIR